MKKGLIFLYLCCFWGCSNTSEDSPSIGLIQMNIRVQNENLKNAFVAQANMQIVSVENHTSFFDFKILPYSGYRFQDLDNIQISGVPKNIRLQTYVSPRGYIGVRVYITTPQVSQTVTLKVSGQPHSRIPTIE